MNANVSRFFVPFLSLSTYCAGALAMLSCASRQYDQGDRPPTCEPGTFDCVCRLDQTCDSGLVCIADACWPLQDPNEPGSALPPEDSDAEVPSTPGDDSPGDPDDDASSKDDPSNDPDSGESDQDSPDDESQDPSLQHCEDGILNADETDIDCGGPVCPRCELDEQCQRDRDCLSNVCENGHCREREGECRSDADCDDADPCTQDTCNTQHACQNSAMAEGTRCDDGDPCTVGDTCRQTRCTGVVAEFSETFSGAGWTDDHAWQQVSFDDDGYELHRASPPRSLWNVGRARASNCDRAGSGEDPAHDHTGDAANGLIGMVVGGCHNNPRLTRESCSRGAPINLDQFDHEVLISWWRHAHTPGVDLSDPKNPKGVEHVLYYQYDIGTNQPSKRVRLPDAENEPQGMIDDKAWVHRSFLVNPPVNARNVAMILCHRRFPGAKNFAGYSIDDLRFRPPGCHVDQ